MEIVKNMMEVFRCLSSRVSLTLRFLHLHLTFFPDNLGALSDKHGVRFYLEVAVVQKH